MVAEVVHIPGGHKMKTEWWPRGAKARLAAECMISHGQLNRIIRGHAITPRLARMLGEASGIPWEAWAAISMGECCHPALEREQWRRGASTADPSASARKKRKKKMSAIPLDIYGKEKAKAREKAKRKRLRRYIRAQKRLADDAS